MADWYGAARSNYVAVADKEGLEKALEHFDIDWWENEDGKIAFSCGKYSNGEWPSWGYKVVDDEETDEEVEFNFMEHIVPFLVDGEILIVMEAGAEKLRYISGYSAAFTKGKEPIFINLTDIYERVSKEWDIPTHNLSSAIY